jgi:hypothetical protein
LKFHLLESFPLAAVSTRRRGFLVGLATTRAGHDASSSAPAGRFPFSTLVAQRGSTGFSVFSIYPLSIVDFMRVFMVAGCFTFLLSRLTLHSLWLLRAPFAPAS